LFSAINDQLKRSNHDSQRQHTYKTLRREAAKYMLEVPCVCAYFVWAYFVCACVRVVSRRLLSMRVCMLISMKACS
jgi:hypothetical protein